MKQNIEGIVLTEIKYGETSKIINIITKEYGLLGLHVKGGNNLKSKTRIPSSKLAHSKFEINYKKDKMLNLWNAELINDFKNIKKDLEKIGYSNILLDLTNQVAKEGASDYLFENLSFALNKINDGLNPEIITQIYMLKCLDNLGIAPCIDCCVECGTSENIVTISSNKGGYLCSNCNDEHSFISEKTIKLIRMFYLVDLKKLDKVEIKPELIIEIDKFIEDYYQRYSGIFLKSKEFLKLIKK